MLDSLAENAQLFFLIFARIMAMIAIAPLLSSRAIPGIARVGLALFAAYAVFPWVLDQGYPLAASGLGYVFLLVGEVLVGIIQGFILVIIYSAFLVAGQFFSLQMGFGASQVFDPMAQVEIPLMGQLLNILAMFVFIAVGGFQRVFLAGVIKSFESVRAVDFLLQKDHLFTLFSGALGDLFHYALIISFPILGTLFLISLSMGLLAKAAPQMNLLMMGFPIAIIVAFLLLFLSLPFIMETFGKIIDSSFEEMLRVLGLAEEAAGG